MNRLRRPWRRNRPRLQPGEVVTFYDRTTGLVPVAHLVVQSYTQDQYGSTMTLVDLGQMLTKYKIGSSP